MSLNVFYITNNPHIALAAEKAGVNRIWVDLETLGKEERQKGLNSVKSHHTIDDIKVISPQLTTAKMLVRINPWNCHSRKEIDDVIDAGADIIMLPMWKSVTEVQNFIDAVDGRVLTTLLLETKEAEMCLEEVLRIKGIDEIHIGLNDLHLSYNSNFMFELLINGVVERIIDKIKKYNIPYGFGGISHLGDGVIPAEMIIIEHYHLGSTRAILSRGFCNQNNPINQVEKELKNNMKALREFESSISSKSFDENKKELKLRINSFVDKLKEGKINE